MGAAEAVGMEEAVAVEAGAAVDAAPDPGLGADFIAELRSQSARGPSMVEPGPSAASASAADSSRGLEGMGVELGLKARSYQGDPAS
jgi:hypothetical protein